MKINRFLGLTFVLAIGASAQSRQWGFDKDTVFESYCAPCGPSGCAYHDTLTIFNNGSSTLRFDTAFAEIIWSRENVILDEVRIAGVTIYGPAVGSGNVPPSGLSALQIPSNSSRPFVLTLVSANASPPPTDSMLVRVVYRSGAQSDTVYILGTATNRELGCFFGALAPGFELFRPGKVCKGNCRDIRGKTIPKTKPQQSKPVQPVFLVIEH